MADDFDAPLRRRAFRRHTVRIVIAYLWAAWAVLFSTFALNLAPPPQSDDAVERAVCGAIALVFWTLAVRTWRIGVFTGPAGVVVRGVLRTWRLRWRDVREFDGGKWGGYRSSVVRRMDFSQIQIFALNPPYQPTEAELARLDRIVTEMNGELEKARAAGLAGEVAPEPEPEPEPGPAKPKPAPVDPAQTRLPV
jgi:hypothetical protein